MKGKTEAQFLAAAKYLQLFESAQIGPMKATDYTQVRVDTSGPRQEQVSALMDFSQIELAGARAALGARAASIVDHVVVFGMSVRGLAAKLRMGQGGQARRRLEKELLEALDVLAKHFKLLPAEHGKPRAEMSGSRLPLVADLAEDSTAHA